MHSISLRSSNAAGLPGAGVFFSLSFFFLSGMSYAILRVEKIKGATTATAKTTHNYRLHPVPNADPNRAELNEELVNHPRRPLWELAEGRVAELGLKRLRTDAVKAVEVLLTASPEAFPRDAEGKAADMRGSAWLSENKRFLLEKFGAANVVALTLHQDEQTPHLHAVIVPATADGRLSARDLFNPQSLRQLQTDYTQAMQAAGLVVQRGIEGSTAKHERVRTYYGALRTAAQDVEKLTAAQIPDLAVAGIQTQRRAQIQRKQLVAAEATKQRNFEALQAAQVARQNLAVRAVQGDPLGKENKELVEQLQGQTRARMEATMTTILARCTTGVEFGDQMHAANYVFVGSGGRAEFVDKNTLVRISIEQLTPNGRPIMDQLAELNIRAEQAKQQVAPVKAHAPAPTKKRGPSL
jgi:hypothetical protein